MKRCPSCNFENTQASSYCERCGSALSSFTNYTDPEEYRHTYRVPDEPPAPPPPSYAYETPASGYQVQAEYVQPPSLNYQSYTAVPLPTRPRTRSGGGITLSTLLFLWGVLCIAFGLAGGMLHEASDIVVGFVFLGACLLGIITMIPILIYRKTPRLRTGMRLLISVGITIVTFVVFVIVVGGLASMMHFTETFTQYYLMGAILVLYGVIIALLANW